MKTLSYSDALREALFDEMREDGKVFLMGEDIGVYGGAFGVTRGMLEEFGPERVVNTPISEGSFVGVGIGAALLGSRPVVEIMFMDFAALAADQLLNQAAKIHYVYGRQGYCPLVVRMVGGGGRNYGPTHSQNLEAWFMHVPGLKVVAPATVSDAYGMLRAAIRDRNPVVFLEHKMLYPLKAKVQLSGIGDLGKAKILREGDDVSILAYSYMVQEALGAASLLEGKGVSAEVIDLRSLNPLDVDTIIGSVEKTGHAVVVAEDTRSGGVAAEVAATIGENAFEYLDAPIQRVTAPDIPISASPSLEQAALPNRTRIAAAVLASLDE